MAPEETAPGRAGRQGEEESETETAERFIAVTTPNHRMGQDRHRYHTIGHQQSGNTKKSKGIDFSTVRGTSSSARPRGAIMQVFFSQNATQEDRNVGAQVHVDTLKLVLDYFTLPSDLTWTWGEGSTERKLNQNWTDIVKSHESMSKTQRHQQEAMWELISTELTYINKLTVVKELVLGALLHCHKYGFLQEVTPTMLFYNLPSILDAHRLFWQDVMSPMLQEVHLTGRPFDPMKLETGCLQFPERFPAYFEYCWERDRNVEFTRRQLETSPQFHTYISWVENHPQCGRMRLGDMLAKPHQRITKYPLLLKAILKNTEDRPTQNALRRMLNSVENFLTSINDHLQLKDDELALSTVAQKIEGYKIEGLSEEIDKHIQEFCCFDMKSPIRGVGPSIIRKQIMDETLKVGGRKDSKELVVLLFTDVLLMTKTQRKSVKLKVARPPLALERIHCIELRDGYSFVLVEVGDLGCAVSVYCLTTPSPDSCSSWVSALREAQATLDTLRKNEASKILKNTDVTELTELNNKAKEEDSISQSESDCDFPPQKRNDSISTNGSETVNNLEQSNAQKVLNVRSSSSIGRHNGHSQSANGRYIEKGEIGLIKSDELISDERRNSEQLEGGEPSIRQFTERRVTWNRVSQATLNLKDNKNQDLKNGTYGQSTLRTALTNEHPDKSQYGKPVEQELDDGSQDLLRKDTLSSGTGVFLSESGNFTRKFGSPRLRKMRLNNPQPSVLLDSSKTGSGEREPDPYITFNSNQKRESAASIKPQDTHRVLKLGSLWNNNRVFWYDAENISSPPQITSELEKDQHFDLETKTKLKTQRSVSVTEATFSNDSSLPTHRLNPSPPPASDSQTSFSPLQDLLQKAKQREKVHRLGKEAKAKPRNFSFPSSSLSPSANEVVVEGTSTNPALRRVQNGTKGSVIDGSGVDWPGWCFDDEEVFDFQGFDDEDFLEQTLTTQELHKVGHKPSERHDDGECSEV